jgi:hypothetical protein
LEPALKKKPFLVLRVSDVSFVLETGAMYEVSTGTVKAKLFWHAVDSIYRPFFQTFILILNCC